MTKGQRRKMRGTEIDDPFYDIHKLQNQRKFENQKKIKEIKSGETTFKGTENGLKEFQKR